MRNRGIALLAITVMLSGLIGLVAVCAFVMGNEADDDARYDETRERILEVKRALIGRLADIGGGEDVTSCGGFISDYGEPFGVPSTFNIDNLLNNSEFASWDYDSAHLFWAGYRGDQYLEINAKDMDGNDTFIDGWGNSIEVSFHSGDTILIRSRGQDNILDEDDGDTTYYGKDIKAVFYWRRPVTISIDNIPADSEVIVQFIYPEKGDVISDSDVWISDGTTPYEFTFKDKKFPIGLRKILVWDAVTGDTEIIMSCIPTGKDTYTITKAWK